MTHYSTTTRVRWGKWGINGAEHFNDSDSLLKFAWESAKFDWGCRPIEIVDYLTAPFEICAKTLYYLATGPFLYKVDESKEMCVCRSILKKSEGLEAIID